MICPSILSSDFSILRETLRDLEESGLKIVHFDVMDNHFVPNLTFGYKLIKDLRKHSKLFFDVHLMIDAPEKNFESYLEAGSDLITVHYEATEIGKLSKISDKVRSQGKKFGISIKPKTPLRVLRSLLPLMDLALIMTVEPGFGGQKLIESCLLKISELKKIKEENNSEVTIQVDGGINKNTLEGAVKRGGQWLVIGSAFFKEKDFKFFPNLLEKVVKNV